MNKVGRPGKVLEPEKIEALIRIMDVTRLTYKEVAQLTGLHPMQVYNATHTGRCRISRIVYDVLTKWLNQKSTKGKLRLWVTQHSNKKA